MEVSDELSRGRIIHGVVAAKSEKTNMAPCRTDGLLFPITLKHSVDTAEIKIYRQVSNIRRTLGGNKIFDHSDVVGASPVSAAPTTSSFST